MSKLTVERLSRRFGAQTVVNDVSFEIADGEFLTLLGPSGCGKTTMLSAIAGLDAPTSGRILIDGEPIFDAARDCNLPPERRQVGMVFQSYALWPHMKVRDNVAFPLRMRGISMAQAQDKIRWALSLVEMEPYIDRYPHELSGGQQQRVALARAMVYGPRLMLLDEPLSNLDAKLRLRARGWLKELQQKLRITTLYVTHDQTEALVLSDRIAVMQNGRIEQLASPVELYEHPQSAFIADFVGHSNLLNGVVQNGAARAKVRFGEHVIAVEKILRAADGAAAAIAVRPENIVLHREIAANAVDRCNFMPGQILQRDFLGARYLYLIETSGGIVRAEVAEHFEKGEVVVELPAHACVAFSRDVAA
ncbi:ABC transporter ATP-binding protein [Steroidobacter sp.]|uniref:ABC transporter ATP-binding protein n=1 Tax=Steroidobacter sp. TaxID=1978227 RepID=UPI001A45BE1F|nr:ABC transporter ATP-binding protein [Steroidobacter sp.]MBL8271398.1 ABC transporter ATP-binding protein [Steroidobacter sp.]